MPSTLICIRSTPTTSLKPIALCRRLGRCSEGRCHRSHKGQWKWCLTHCRISGLTPACLRALTKSCSEGCPKLRWILNNSRLTSGCRTLSVAGLESCRGRRACFTFVSEVSSGSSGSAGMSKSSPIISASTSSSSWPEKRLNVEGPDVPTAEDDGAPPKVLWDGNALHSTCTAVSSVM